MKITTWTGEKVTQPFENVKTIQIVVGSGITYDPLIRGKYKKSRVQRNENHRRADEISKKRTRITGLI